MKQTFFDLHILEEMVEYGNGGRRPSTLRANMNKIWTLCIKNIKKHAEILHFCVFLLILCAF